MRSGKKVVLLAKPAWIPKTAGIRATLYADFTKGRYWYAGRQYGDAASWIASLSGTFSRTSTAYYTNSAGLLVSASSGALRFDYDPVTLLPKGILLEGARTNLCLQSGALTTTWSTSGTGSSVASGASDPFGGTAAVTITATAGGSTHLLFQNEASQSASAVYTKSMFLAPGTAAYGVIGENNDTPWIWAAVKWSDLSLTTINCTAKLEGPYANGFYRLSLTYTRAAAVAAKFVVGPGTAAPTNANYTYSAAGTETVIAIGAQDELGSFASSYIPTTTGSVTRAADSLQLGPSAGLPLTAPFTLYANAIAYQPGTTVNNQGVVAALNSGNSNRAYFDRSNDQPRVIASNAGDFAAIVTVGTTKAAGVPFRVAGRYDTNNVNGADNGVLGTVDTSIVIPSLDRVALGDLVLPASSLGALFGNLKEFGMFATGAADAELQRLTT